MMISRRRFETLLLSGTAAAAVSLGLATGAMAQDATSHLGIDVDKIGLVGFTIREQIGQDARGTIEAVANCGIENIEFSGPNFDGDEPSFQGVPISDIKAYAAEFGFNVPSLGVNVPHLVDNIDDVIAAAKEVGATHVRISGSSSLNDQPAAEYYTELAGIMNTAGAALKPEGITLSYHNHGWEFDDIGDGRTGYDILLAELDPEVTGFELDLYWAVVGAADPVELISNNPGRFVTYHVKDAQNVTVEGEEQITFATVGQGFLDFPAIFALPGTENVEYFFIENDRPEPDGITSACEGYAYLSAETAP